MIEKAYRNQSDIWKNLIVGRLITVSKDVRIAKQLFVNSRSYTFSEDEAKEAFRLVTKQLDFVRESYMRGTPSDVPRAEFIPFNDEEEGLTKEQRTFRRMANRRLGIRLLPHLASVGTASRRTSYEYPVELGKELCNTLDRMVEPLLAVIKDAIDENWEVKKFESEYEDYFNSND